MAQAPAPTPASDASGDGDDRKKTLKLTRKPAAAYSARPPVRGGGAGRGPSAGGPGRPRPSGGGGGFGPAGGRGPRDAGRDGASRDGAERRGRPAGPRADDRRGEERRFDDRRGDDRRFDDRRGDDRRFDDRRGDAPRFNAGDRFSDRQGNRPAATTPGNVWRADAAPRTMQTAAAQAQNIQLKEEGQVRVNKRLSDMGMCSRREGDVWIENGWVLVNGVVAEMGQLVNLTDKIEVKQAAQDLQDQQVTILLHKPMGYVSGQAEDGHEPAMALIDSQSRWREDHSKTRFNFSQLKGLAPCGRLDIDSVGLLVLTQDGRVAKQIIGEESDMDKEYLVRVTYGAVDKDVQSRFPADQLALLRHGLSLDDQPLLAAEVEWQNPEQLRFVLREGKKRQIRRMCEQVGLHVVGLKRIRIGGVVLGNLPVGNWRYLMPGESF